MIKKIVLNWFEIITWENMILENAFLEWNTLNQVSYLNPYSTWIWISSNKFGENMLYIKGLLKWTDKYDLKTRIDSFISKIYKEETIDIEVYVEISVWVEKKLVWKWYINTQNPFPWKEHWMINIIPLEFNIMIPDWYLEEETITTGALYSINYSWQFKTHFKYVWTVWIWWGWSVWLDRYLQLWYNWKYIRIYWPFSHDDVITIDWTLKEVRKNDDLVDYSWIFPELIQGENTLEVWSWFTNWTPYTLPLPSIIYEFTNKYVKI